MAYIRLDKIKASAHLESIVAEQDLKNGVFVTLGELQEDGEARLVKPMVEGDTDVVLHASVPLTYRDDENELDYILKAGKEGRGYVMETGNEVSFSEDLVTGVAVKNKFVKVTGAGVEVVEVKPEGLHGQIIALEEDVNVGTLVVVRFVK